MSRYSRWGFFKNKHNAGSGSAFVPVVNIAENYSDNTTGLSNVLLEDYKTITYTITSNLPNTQLKYKIPTTGNITSSDFADNTLNANISTDSNGNATITKTITTSTGSGHKSFNLEILKPTVSETLLASSANTFLYEVIPFDISGGDTVVNVDVVTDSTDSGNVLSYAMKSHRFTTPGNANLTISHYGNYEGNANIWNEQFLVDNPGDLHGVSYWGQGGGGELGSQSGLVFKSLIIGGGGVKGSGAGNQDGGGAGELGVIKIPFANVSLDTYTITVGPKATVATNSHRQFIYNYATAIAGWTNIDDEKTVIFAGNTDISYTAAGGGSDFNITTNRCAVGGSSSGGQQVLYANVGYSDFTGTYIHRGDSDLFTYTDSVTGLPVDKVPSGDHIITAPRDGVLNTADFSIGHQGGTRSGGGAGQPGGINEGGAGNQLQVGRNPSIDNGAFTVPWYDNAYVNPNSSIANVAGGGGAFSGPDGFGSDGFGGGDGVSSGAQDGIAVITYPYKPAYRFIVDTEIT